MGVSCPNGVPVSPLAGTTVVATVWDVVPMEPSLRASLRSAECAPLVGR